MPASIGAYRKAILYAGGGLTGLYPVTSVVPKALLPIYDKPLVYYSLSVLMLAGIREIALVTELHDRAAFQRLLGDGRQFGIRIEYLAHQEPLEPAQSILLARDFIGDDPVAMILGDCLIYGDGLQRVLNETTRAAKGATVFAHPVGSPERFAIVELAGDGAPQSLEDHPTHPKSNLAITGIFFYDRAVVAVAEGLQEARPDGFGLTDVHRAYLAQGRLHVRVFGRGFAWLDTTTHASFNAAANFIETIESTHGLKIACLEEIAYRKGFITAEEVAQAAATMNNAYGQYLQRIAPAVPSPLVGEG
jgi:glucose-1-phosphate thymidylyltransferase